MTDLATFFVWISKAGLNRHFSRLDNVTQEPPNIMCWNNQYESIDIPGPDKYLKQSLSIYIKKSKNISIVKNDSIAGHEPPTTSLCRLGTVITKGFFECSCESVYYIVK